MADDRSSRISDLYERALARPPAERERFLHDACRDDDALRREVESLLEFEAASERFLERPARVMLETWRRDDALTPPRKSPHEDQ